MSLSLRPGGQRKKAFAITSSDRWGSRLIEAEELKQLSERGNLKPRPGQGMERLKALRHAGQPLEEIMIEIHWSQGVAHISCDDITQSGPIDDIIWEMQWHTVIEIIVSCYR